MPLKRHKSFVSPLQMVVVGLVVVAQDLLAHRPQVALSQQLLQVVRVAVAHAVPEVPQKERHLKTKRPLNIS